jgi:cysteine desulfurase/selenocysteine lyase
MGTSPATYRRGQTFDAGLALSFSVGYNRRMDWVTLRSEFPVTDSWVYMDHAAVAPLPSAARQVLIDWADDVARNGVVNNGAWQKQIERIRERFATLLHAHPQDIAFVKNTSEGIGIVAEGLHWQRGDNLVSVEGEYPANVYPWLNLADRGVEYRAVPLCQGRVIMDELAAAIDARTRLVTISFVEFATGFRNDLDRIGQLCRERGVLFFVDAIQGLGVLPLDVEKTPIDFLAADGHKWLVGPEGAGILWIRRDCLEQLHPVGIGWNSVVDPFDFSKIDFRLKPHAGRYESGTLNVPGILALGASLDLLLRLGVSAISQRIRELTDRLCAGIERTNWHVYSSRRDQEWSGIVSLQSPDGIEPMKVVRLLRQRGVVVNARAGRLRISPHCYNSPEEIDRLVDLLGELA